MRLKSWLVWLALGLGLQALDVLFTVLLLRTGRFTEFNPFMAWMFEGSHELHGLFLKCCAWLVVMGLVALPGARESVRTTAVVIAVAALLIVNVRSLFWVLSLYL